MITDVSFSQPFFADGQLIFFPSLEGHMQSAMSHTRQIKLHGKHNVTSHHMLIMTQQPFVKLRETGGEKREKALGKGIFCIAVSYRRPAWRLEPLQGIVHNRV